MLFVCVEPKLCMGHEGMLEGMCMSMRVLSMREACPVELPRAMRHT